MLYSCTNYGMAFTKNGEPSDTKFAMIDRSVAHLVRSIGKHAHTDSEFKAHMSKPEQKTKLTRFRIFVCLVGATKLAIKGIPDFQPNFALANKMFDHLDKDVIVGEYNLPRCSPRKSLKREGNLLTMCIMKAVSDVFIFKQTAVEFESGQLDDSGNPPPFKFTMLYDVIRQLRATPELIFMAWSQSLDYNIGTAAHSMATMTALCEHFKITIGDWFKCSVPEGYDQAADAPPAVVAPAAGGSSEREAATLIQNQQYRMKHAYSNNATCLPNLMLHGLSLEQRQAMLTMYERQRRATSLYRHTCTLDGNTDLEMGDVKDTIDRVMKNQVNPPDFDPSSASAEAGDCLPVYTSMILASTVQTCVLYNFGAVMNWCNDEASCGHDVGNETIGSKVGIDFSEKKSNGPCSYNTAWLRTEAKDGLTRFASEVANNNQTCKMFDLAQNSLRDSIYLLTTRDNSRRCTEMPRVAHCMQPYEAFTDERATAKRGDGYGSDDNDAPKRHKGLVRLKMSGMWDSRGNQYRPGSLEKKRHPYSMVANTTLQRQVDFIANKGRLPALMPMVSNNVRDSAPVRIVTEGDKKYVEINTAAAHEHTRMLAEASVRCSVQPGLENLQEVFCGDSQGPDGLCFDDSGKKKPESDDCCLRMAFSFDLVSIAVTLDVMNRAYDPNREDYVKLYNEAFSNLNPGFETKDLPHMCLRFVGYENTVDRRLLSIPVNDKPNKAFRPVEVGDADQTKEDFESMKAHLALSLGHNPSEDEIDRYIKSRAGSRSMSGVCGDLMNMQTYIEHTLTTMKERGMMLTLTTVEDGKLVYETDVVGQLVQDDPYGLRSRIAEIAGRKINRIVDKHKEIKKAKNSLPDNHENLPQETIDKYRTEKVARARARLYKTIPLDPYLDELRHYSTLDIPEVKPFTFHNTKATKNYSNDVTVVRKKIDSSSQFKDNKRLMLHSLPNKKKHTSSGAGPSGSGVSLSCRGYVDGRSKGPVLPR